MRNVWCKSCGWCHFGVSPEQVKAWYLEWVVLSHTKDVEWLEAYGLKPGCPPSAQREFYQCHRCGGSYKNFVDTGKVPDGSTISGILGAEFEVPNLEASNGQEPA